MGPGRPASSAALALVGVLVVPLAAAADAAVAGGLTSTGPTRILGENQFLLETTGLLLQDGPAGTTLGLAAVGAEARLILVQTQQVRTAAGVATAPVRGDEHIAAQTVLRGGSLSFSGPAGESAPVVRVLARGVPLELALSGSREVGIGPTSPLEPADRDTSFGSSATLQGEPTRPPEDGGFVEGLPPDLSWDGPYGALLSGGRVDLPDGTQWTTGRFLNASASTIDPVSGNGRYVYDNYVAVLQGRGATLHLGEGVADWRASASALSGHLDGDVAWTGVQADVRSQGRPLPADPELFQLRGQLDLDGRFAGGATWQVAGQAHFINVDGTPFPPGAAATAAGAGLLAALLLVFTESGRGVLAFVLGRNAPRLVKAAPLGNASRQRILNVIHTQQPVRITELRAATGLTKTALSYHLRILMAYEVIQQTRADTGRNTAFMLNSGSLAFRVFGDPLEAAPADDEGFLASEALAVVNSHSVRRSIHAILQASGPLDFEGINRERVRRGEPALVQSSATHHLQALVRAQAIQARREGRRKVYAAAIDAQAARLEQYRRFLGQVHGIELVRALRLGAANEHDVLARLGPAAGRSERRTLERLRAIGLVEFDPAQRTYQLAGFLGELADRI